MRILVLTHYYPPEIGAPQARLSEMALSWKNQGHAITVLTGFPNHPTGIIPEKYKGKFFAAETENGMTVWRHWLYATPNEGFIRRTLNHLSFMFTSVLFSLFRGEKPDAILVSSPTLFSVISAYVMSVFRQTPFIFEVRDLWPGIFIELGILKNRFLIAVLECLELFLYKKAAHVVTVTEGFKKNLVSRGISENKISVITNGADLNKFFPVPEKPAERKEWGIPENVFLASYIGAHGMSHGLASILDAANMLQLKKEPIHFLFVGEGSEKEKCINKAEKLKLKNVTFLGGQPKEKIPSFYQLSDLCLVSLRSIPGFKSFIPSKMFEMMACGKPVLGAVEGEAADILTRSKGAIVVPPENSGAIAEHIVTLKDNPLKLSEMGKNASHFVIEHYNREKLALKYLDVFKTVSRKSPL
ncbi:MAG: glycosyltransferase family 4 protein [Candidatus Aureabacteria bacterium]|nr:glycosyltransferase family 4 protein [Candidatus Auribacterota bacterium]